MSQTVGLAEYACDSCRARKLKCSRERPKCTNCAMWPGPCVYSKQGPAMRQTRSKNLEAFRTHSPNSASASSPSIEARLATVEASLSRLASAVQSLTETINDKPRQAVPPHPTYDRYPDIESTNVMPPSPHKTAIQDEADTSCYVGNSPASSILIQGPKDLDQLQGISLGQGEARTVASGLRDLSQAFATMGFKDEVRRELRNRRRESDLFHVPGKSLGAQLIQKFSDIISIGDPFFSSPAPDLLPKLVFEPWNVSERGWVIIFNCLLAADIPPDDPFAEGLRLKLRWNTWLALEDSCIFLEPSTVKIQALVLVACHGEDFATPSLSWNLVGHACRMAQALGLHTLGSTTNAGKQSSDQALCLFWSLFMIDKSLSLAFGRPPFLPGLFYERVPVPGLNLLAKFKPHAPRAEREDAQENKGKDMFGAFYVLQSLKLARIMGAISDGLQAGSGAIMKGDTSDGFITGHKEDLDAWMRETFEIVPKHGDNTLRSPSERKEILLGLHFLQFQYHHLVIFLTRSHAPSKQVCIESAREALSLLKNLVSSSEQVYNGITWQLLYYPFTPFFALLGSIISDPNSGDSLSDLLLLRLTVSYFGEMDKIHPHASKLKDVTETFCQLAEAYVSRAGNNKHMNLYNGTQEDGGFGSLKNRESDAQCNANGGNKNSFPFVPVKPSPHSTLSDTQEFVALNDFPTDPAHLLDLFSVPPQDLSSINHWIPTNMPMDIELDTGDQINENFTGSEIGLIQSLHSKILDRPMEGTFDWFSWDMYNQDPLDMSDYT